MEWFVFPNQMRKVLSFSSDHHNFLLFTYSSDN
jgi:hypothetical protein